MAKRADIWPRWRKLKTGKKVLACWYVTVDGRPVRLRTKDATVARQRARDALAGKWPPWEEAAATATQEAFQLPVGVDEEPAHEVPSGDAPAVSASTSGNASPQTPVSPTSDWTQAAAGASADASPPITPEVVDPAAEQAKRSVENAQFARGLVETQLWATAAIVRAKVYKAFQAPVLDDGAKQLLSQPYETLLNYGGLNLVMPPWVTGLLIPGITALVSAIGLGQAFAEVAREQKAAAAGAQKAAA